ncbi:hypothetical protein ANOM_004053 [Aspergillus nomiae NRRL 13137]|uniref:Uncharacterized protein n=1 Tax=Aspergillus nomiae NRRL (strain ATCC 15546 / NRRL 13137 / CBS 260.88 / M93) TaxID=1509407 RepID=A0A0L1J755_ASPN3|nr:uncharacterized protein ANOM_004053 [Aspergillus nomiae NRRL 13137]KNG87572.1 hypothetical protein ANOM_004053 [Aspergillus nomiae NRRL 13137]
MPVRRRIPTPDSIPMDSIITPLVPTGIISTETGGLLRAGGPRLCELPYNSHDIRIRQIPFYTIQSIIQTLNICASIGFVECTPCYDDSAEPIPTLQVCVDPRKNEARKDWLNAAQELYDLLCRYGLEYITVDIIDCRLEQGPSIFICEPTDAIFSKWDMVRQHILHSVDVSGFQLLGCYRMGYETRTENCKPTILVTVDPECERDWGIAKQEIRNILNSLKLAVDVQIFKDRSIFCARRPSIQSELNSRRPVHMEDCPRVATIGHRVGAHNSDRYGTFGGWLNIRQKPDSEWERFGLTCRHCIFDDQFEDFVIHDPRAQTLEHVGDNRLSLPESAQEVDCPSYGEIKMYIDGLKKTISDLKKEHPYPSLEELRLYRDPLDDLSEACWKRLRAPIDGYEGWIAELEAYCDSNMHRFGKIWAHSGDGTRRTTTVMDWALLKPYPTRAYPSNKFGGFANQHDPRSLKVENGFIEDSIELHHSDLLHKSGCITNTTTGQYNMLATTVFTATANGQLRTTNEHSVICKKKKSHFEPGDSGSLLFTESGAMVGMGFGAQVGGQIVVFTHVDDLIADIKSQTGVDQVTFYAQEWTDEVCEKD